ncbi:lipocalin family protein [Bordetella sp. BOR01]|uniref:lipocalin family protein n=1 Tax=Bordetella sp. BOR01 TaxID=2854779 RepID=UPI001C43EC19|nr:lipocalin family protein [Bordetella sp. BOR01]MBV7484554.1 lipocalin family protein [Bordetella sp. BOR01]
MPRHLVLILSAALLGLAGVVPAAPPLQAVDTIDLERYAGKWYEIARLPTPLQRLCVDDATVEYTVAPQGALHINNRCRTKDGSIAAVSGLATQHEGATGAQYQADFLQPATQYWIIGLDSDYRWAVIGGPERKTLWILARTPQLPPEQLEQALQAARAQGYTLDELQYTPQH